MDVKNVHLSGREVLEMNGISNDGFELEDLMLVEQDGVHYDESGEGPNVNDD